MFANGDIILANFGDVKVAQSFVIAGIAKLYDEYESELLRQINIFGESLQNGEIELNHFVDNFLNESIQYFAYRIGFVDNTVSDALNIKYIDAMLEEKGSSIFTLYSIPGRKGRALYNRKDFDSIFIKAMLSNKIDKEDEPNLVEEEDLRLWVMNHLQNVLTCNANNFTEAEEFEIDHVYVRSDENFKSLEFLIPRQRINDILFCDTYLMSFIKGGYIPERKKAYKWIMEKCRTFYFRQPFTTDGMFKKDDLLNEHYIDVNLKIGKSE